MQYVADAFAYVRMLDVKRQLTGLLYNNARIVAGKGVYKTTR